MVKLPSLLELLALSQLADLREIAASRGIRGAADAVKGELIYTLAERLLEPASLREAIDSLTLNERIAWNALVEAGGRLDGYGFPNAFGPQGREELRGATRPPTKPARASGAVWPGERLERLGLVFAVSLPYYITCIPAEVMLAVGVLLPVPARPPGPVGAPPDFGPACDMIGALVIYLSYCRGRRVALTKDNELHQRHLGDLGFLLWPHFSLVDGPFAGSEVWFLYKVRDMLERLRLIESGDRDLVVLSRAETWLASPRPQLMVDIWTAFFRDTEDEVLSRSDTRDGTAGTAPTGLLSALCACLADCPTGQWVATSELFDYLYLRYPRFVRSWRGYESHYGSGEVPEGLGMATPWPRTQARNALSFMRNGLRWLGAVDIATDFTAIRLTGLGAYLLGKAATWDDEPEPRPIIIQPNFEVIVPAEAAPGTLYRLDGMADHVSRDRASIYTITQASIRRAMESGHSVDQILTFLTEAAARDLPQNIAFSIRGWADRYGEIEIRHMTVLLTAREDLITELGSSAKLKLKLGERLGPHAVAVANDDLPALLTRMRKAGLSPRVGPQVDRPGATSAQSVNLPESELVVLLAAAIALNEKAEPETVPASLITSVQKHLSRSGRVQASSVARSIRTVLTAQGRHGRQKGDKPAARFPRTHTEPALRKAMKERQPVTMEYYDGNASEFSLEVIYPRRIEATQGTDLLYGETVLSGHMMVYFMDQIRTVRPGAYAPASQQVEE